MKKHNPIFIVSYWIYRFFVGLVCTLPVSSSYFLARRLADLCWLVNVYHRGVSMRNLELCFENRFSRSERSAISRDSFQHTAMTMVDAAISSKVVGQRTVSDLLGMTPDQEAHMQSLLADKRPVVLMMAHIGSWELSTALAAFYDQPMGVVYRAIPHPQINRHFREKLRKLGKIFLIEKNDASREIGYALKSGCWIALLLDLNAGDKAAFLKFFNHYASTNVRVFSLFRRYNPRIVFVPIIREGKRFSFRMEELRETAFDQRVSRQTECMRLGTWYMNYVEELVEKYPEQYLWTHRRFASRPKGSPRLYYGLNKPVDPDVLALQARKTVLPAKWREEKIF